MREIEVKLKISDFSELEQKLKEKGLVFSAPISQYDRMIFQLRYKPK